MNTLYAHESRITAKKTESVDINCPVPFLQYSDRRAQTVLIDTPDELYYNPSTRTLYADNFSGAMPSLTEGEAVKLTTDNNTTKIDVDFSKNTDILTTLLDHGTLLVSNTSNALKTIRADLLKSDIRLTAGDNLSYGTDSNSNRLFKILI